MPKLATRADSSQGDLAAIGDQHALHRSPPSCALLRCRPQLSHWINSYCKTFCFGF